MAAMIVSIVGTSVSSIPIAIAAYRLPLLAVDLLKYLIPQRIARPKKRRLADPVCEKPHLLLLLRAPLFPAPS
jgi:hypothetical protein